MSEQTLPEEHKFIIKVGANSLATLLCTPNRLEELAAGWLFAQGLPITSATPIRVESGDRESIAVVKLNDSAQTSLNKYSAAGFDASTVLARAGAQVPDDAGMLMDAFEQQVQTIFDAFRERRGAGGYHHAGLASETDVLGIVTDISRHNAVDKISGMALRKQLDVRRAAIMLSGRISADIALKAARIGVPIIATRSLPTQQAVELAEAAGLQLVCRVLDHRRIAFGLTRLVQ